MSAPGGRDLARVALVLVSHSRDLAAGTVELAGQMAPGVLLLPVGGTPDGQLGTDFDGIERAVAQATADGRSAVVLMDLGSAVLTTESVLDLADEELVARVRLADAPFVEGAVAAAVTAHGGADLDAVLAAAEGAGRMYPVEEAAGDLPAPSEPADDGVVRETRTLLNPMGLHARPAAVISRMLAAYDAKVTVNGVSAASVLALMKLGATQGTELRIEAEGPQAAEAVKVFVTEVERGFGEI
ncbi:dihydroxyacetone kinase phosphoryl donor subunit DhaM [Cellulomonas sp. PhB150]|uniref:dihydroxyacetone kinase phosphoryl donor subunit DhaM n=1 Tax=Cellulomonas sp. PhB150 TaxID=2485188 RepID=UPI000F934930|nr:dihydroxyacetone kinase phosphoryl donor subunit DhaM [Cellulomonas sp. PhB150]ROS28071.1 phosphocarrier protein HPr /dihydroxyacetone kinase DhaM subunit [Cellulomonas sp. PhB150]